MKKIVLLMVFQKFFEIKQNHEEQEQKQLRNDFEVQARDNLDVITRVVEVQIDLAHHQVVIQ